MLRRILLVCLLTVTHACMAADIVTILQGEPIARTYAIQRLESNVKAVGL